MIDVDFLDRLIRMVDESGLDSLEIERGGTRIRLAKTPDYAGGVPGVVPAGPAPAMLPVAPHPALGSPESAPVAAGGAPADAAESPESEDDHLIDVPSPMVGTFYRAPAPDAPPYVEVGASIARGQTLCIIEAMKLMNELESEWVGKVVDVCVENGEPVEYGQVLFRVEPT